eukprot:gene2601-3224_t
MPGKRRSTTTAKKTTTPKSSTRKQKKVVSDEEDEIDNHIGEEEEEEQSDSDDNVKSKSKRKSKSTTSRKSKGSTTSTTKKKRKSKSIKTDFDLFGILDEWIDRYNEDAEEAVFEILNLIFDCGGAESELTFQDFKDLEIDEGSRGIVKQPDSLTYPLGSKRHKHLFENYTQFFNGLIMKSQQQILFDGYLIDMLVLWFHQVSHAEKRGLRYSVMQACISITNALLDICVELKKQLSLISRQIQAEQSTKNASRAKQMKENHDRLAANLKSLEKTIAFRIFKGIFSERFSDVLPEFRGLCLEYFPVWILKYPSLLLNGENLKYLGKAINDWITDVRLKAVRSINALYENGANHLSQLDAFTQRFKHRIIDIAFKDKIHAVSAEGIKLVATMAGYDLIDQLDLLKICNIYCTSLPDVKREAGKLIHQTYLEGTQQKFEAVSKTDPKGERFTLRLEQITSIMKFLDQSPASNEPHHLVLSLWESSESILTDWTFYVKFFSELESRNITEKQLATLFKILRSTIAIASGQTQDSTPPAQEIENQPQQAALQFEKEKNSTSSKKKKKDTTKEKSSKYEISINEMTAAFIPVLPNLLQQFKSNISISQSLLEISSFLNLDAFVSLRLQNHFTLLLESIQEILLLHPHENLVRAATMALEHLTQSSSQLESVAKLTIQEIYNSLAENLKLLIKVNSKGEPDIGDIEIKEASPSPAPPSNTSITASPSKVGTGPSNINDLIFTAIVTLQKLDTLGKIFYFDDPDLDKLLFPLIYGTIQGKPIPNQEDREKVMKYALLCYSQLLMWLLINDIPENLNLPPINDRILKMHYVFCNRMMTLMSLETSPSFKHFVVTIYIETRIHFSRSRDLTVLHWYNIKVPSERIVKKTLKYLFNNEHINEINQLKNNFMETQLENSEKRKAHKRKRSSSRSTSNKKSGDESNAEDSTSHSEKETTTDHETSESEARDSDEVIGDRLYVDPEFQQRIEELVLTVVRAIKFKFLNPNFMKVLLEQVALSPSAEAMETIKEFVHEYKFENEESEASIIYKVLIKVFKEFASDEMSEDDQEFQSHMFTRFRSLVQWICNEFMKYESTGSVVGKLLKFTIETTEVKHMSELLTVVHYLSTRISKLEAQNLIKQRIVVPLNHKYVEIFQSIFKTIEYIARQKEDVDPSAKKKSSIFKFSSTQAIRKITGEDDVDSEDEEVDKPKSKPKSKRKSNKDDDEEQEDEEDQPKPKRRGRPKKQQNGQRGRKSRKQKEQEEKEEEEEEEENNPQEEEEEELETRNQKKQRVESKKSTSKTNDEDQQMEDDHDSGVDKKDGNSSGEESDFEATPNVPKKKRNQ